MTSRERMMRTLDFDYPDRLPVHSWALPEVYLKYGEKLRDEVARYSADVHCPVWRDGEFPFDRYAVGRFKDAWGCEWLNHRQGIVGEVKSAPLADWAALAHFRAPLHVFSEGRETIADDIAAHREKFMLPYGPVNLFERMQHIRGTENLLMDIAEQSGEFFTLLDIVYDFYDTLIDMWLDYDIDALNFADDWGTQTSLLVSPDVWRRIFKPRYRELMDKIKRAGRRVFFHSDGRIEAIFGDLVELGCDAINAQVWIMDKETLSRNHRGKVTFWGELDRQGVLARGVPGEILRDIEIMKSLFMHQGGGLIGTAAPSDDCSYEGIVASVAGWNRGLT
jgi:uroporphyrinogen decarboxylase